MCVVRINKANLRNYHTPSNEQHPLQSHIFACYHGDYNIFVKIIFSYYAYIKSCWLQWNLATVPIKWEKKSQEAYESENGIFQQASIRDTITNTIKQREKKELLCNNFW
jgi:hypothetical protein